LAVVNYSTREVNCKLVYCGPGLSGKTTNILQIYQGIKKDRRGKLVSLSTNSERTLFFDFLPIDLGTIYGFRVRLHLYTVPGQVYYSASRRLVFRGVDGIVFVADSNSDRSEANLEALRDLADNMNYYGLELDYLPYALQLNKRDEHEAMPIQEMIRDLNLRNEPVIQAVAIENRGVRETLTEIARQLLRHLKKELTPQ
jgi:signal recognition particle receptor subunit beta